MYKIEDNTKYYLYQRSYNASSVFDNFEQLILYFQKASRDKDEWYMKRNYNSLLDNYGVTFQDSYIELKYEHIDDEIHSVNIIKVIRYKEYVVYDSNNKFINMFNYKKQIFDKEYYNYLKSKYPIKYKTKSFWYRKWGRNYDHPYIFRSDPVPHSGGQAVKRRRKFRKHFNMNELKQSQEKPKYNRKGRLIYFKTYGYDIFDYDLYRNKPIKCWKNQNKKKHQWM